MSRSPMRIRQVVERRKALITAAAVFLLGGAGAGAFFFMAGQPRLDQPVLLRPLEGEVRASAEEGAPMTKARDRTWLFGGATIRSGSDGRAVVQYFDGSAIEVSGEAALTHAWSRSLRGQPFAAGRSAALEVRQGEVTISAMRSASLDSLFEVETPGSIGVAGGGAFRVNVEGGGQALWLGSAGTVRIAAITTGPAGQARIALVSLESRDAVSVPAPAPAWTDQDKRTLLDHARSIARAAARTGQTEVSVSGATLVDSDAETGVAVYDVAVESAGTGEEGPSLPAGYSESASDVLGQEAPDLILGGKEGVVSFTVPAACLAGLWEEVPPEEVTRAAPPTYKFSILDVVKPLGVAVDQADGRIIITESGGERATYVFDAQGRRMMSLAPPGTDPGSRTPVYVAVDGMGTAYVSDRTRHVIDMYDVNGAYLGAFDPGADVAAGWSPLAVHFDDCGSLFVTDVSGNEHRVLKFSRAGRLLLDIGGEGRNALAFPSAIATDGEGHIYVADSNNFRMQVYDSDGQRVGTYAGQAFPRGLDIRGRYLYVVDTFGHTITVYDLGQGLQPSFTFGVPGVGDGEFNFPNGLELDSDDRVYITDRESNRVQVWGYD